MTKIDFVPEDYIQNKESTRANFFYLAMVVLIVAALGGSYSIIKIRQNAVAKEAQQVDERMAELQQAITKLEYLQTERTNMLRTALMAAELIEPVPRSIVIAFLTNCLGNDVSLTKVSIAEKRTTAAAATAATKYDALKAAAKSTKNDYITAIEIEGVAVSDIGVAEYIAALGNSEMLSDVYLVHSKQKQLKGINCRQFKLTAQIKSGYAITEQEIAKIADE